MVAPLPTMMRALVMMRSCAAVDAALLSVATKIKPMRTSRGIKCSSWECREDNRCCARLRAAATYINERGVGESRIRLLAKLAAEACLALRHGSKCLAIIVRRRALLRDSS
jgi:hypothetical protein